MAAGAITPFRRAGHWMLESGIQEPSGGVARYYLVDEARNLPVSTEITGYAASALAFLYEETGESAYLTAAVRAARFLCREAWDPKLGAMPFETLPGSPSYFFDCGIIVRGLLAVWRITRDQEPLDVAFACGRAMGRDFLTDTGIHPVIALPDKTAWPYEKRWSREPGCFQLKAALAWHDLAEISGDPQFREWWERALIQAEANDIHFLPGAPERARVMDRLHAYSYYLEAMLAAGRGDLLEAGLGRAGAYLREIAPEFARSDVYAQLLRVRLLAAASGLVEIDVAAAEEEAQAITAFQYSCEDPRLDGGYSFGAKAGRLLPFANPVSTAFCMQARHWWTRYEAGTASVSLDRLI